MSRAIGDDAPRDLAGPRIGIVLGGVAWLLATVQYAVAQIVAAAAWTTPWSWSDNYISDLGNTACGMFAASRSSAAYVCSPLHSVMNISFVVAGLLTIAGAVLLRGVWPARRLTDVAVVLWVVAGCGKVVVGLVPENANAALHVLGALNLPVGAVAILLLSVSIRRGHRTLGVIGVATAVVQLVGATLSAVGPYAGPAVYLGIGVGGMERVAGYPGNLWMAMIGIATITFGSTSVGDPASRPQRATEGRESSIR